VQFLSESYTDQQLAALLAHAQDGKLSFCSCCCLIGITNAPHALRGYIPEFEQGCVLPPGSTHHQAVRMLSELAADTEQEFAALGTSDEERRAAIIPLIEAEIQRRDQKSSIAEVIAGASVLQLP
jgi:hypothetical protein